MKKITYLLLGLVFAFVSPSCEDEDPDINVFGEEDVIVPAQFNTPEATEFTLSEETPDDVAASFSWKAAEGEYNGNITYYLVASKAGESFDFSKAETLDVSTADLTVEVTHVQMNKPLIDLGVKAGEATDVELRIMAVLNLDKDFAFSNPITINATAYEMATGEEEAKPFYLVGGPNGWAIDSPYQFAHKGENKYEIFVHNPNDQGFKVCETPGDWSSCWKEDTENEGTLIFEEGDPNIALPEVGFYLIEIDMTEGEETITKTKIDSWGIIGSAAGGWDNDVDMTYDVDSNTWSVTLDMVEGQWKIRANDDWAIALKDEDLDGILENVGGDPNLEMTEAGNYTITMELGYNGNYTYTVTKN
ncbi:hypothetical protein EYV94_17210 [Puteibacter caeruleilacunae]|nr:hypothetical protein EYV94_17210 [Puteibacter caeruleilacunae]